MKNSVLYYIKKKPILIGVVVFVVLGGITAFSLYRERAKTSNENLIETSSNKSQFLNFAVSGESIYNLSSDNEGKRSITMGDSIVYTTENPIQKFKVIDNSSIIYQSYEDSTHTVSIYHVDLKSSKETILYTSKNIDFGVANNLIYIMDLDTGTMLYGEYNNLSKVSLDKPIDKFIVTKNVVVALKYRLIGSELLTDMYVYTDNSFSKIHSKEGKIVWVSADYKNNNKLYITTQSVYKGRGYTLSTSYMFVKDNAVISEKEYPVAGLQGYIYALENELVYFNPNKSELYSLDIDMKISHFLGKVHSSSLYSHIQESNGGANLHYIDSLDSMAVI